MSLELGWAKFYLLQILTDARARKDIWDYVQCSCFAFGETEAPGGKQDCPGSEPVLMYEAKMLET